MTIVMGLDQHRAQITAEWLDTESGEITRSRITPAHRQGVRRFCETFRGQELEVALEATTGWRFVADELRQIGAVVHLAEPAETAARRGNKKRAKSDRADARHHRRRRQPRHHHDHHPQDRSARSPAPPPPSCPARAETRK
jgi:transposase